MRGVTVGIILLVLITSGYLAYADTSGDAPEAISSIIETGETGETGAAPEPAHDFTLETLTGEPVSLNHLQGQWVIVNFWATWCKPCVEEMPYLQRLAAERDIVVLGVNFNEPAETVTGFVADHNISFPILLNPDDITLLVYQVRGLPRTLVIAPDGTIALNIVGAIDPDKLDLWLDDHLAGDRY